MSFKSMRMAERFGVAQPGEEKTLGRPYSSLIISKGNLKDVGEGTFYLGVY